LRPAAPGPHGAAPAAHDGGAAATVAGRAAVPAPARPAQAGPHLLGRPPLPLAFRRQALPAPDAPDGGAGPLRGHDLAVARPRRLRPRPALAGVALPPARVLPAERAAVLVSGRPPLPVPPALVAVAAVPVPDPGRRVEHAPVGPADLLRPHPV